MNNLKRVASICTLLIAGICLTTCEKVNELDDNAQISAVKIESTTHAVLLGDPRIEKEEVLIPLIFGKYLFPIEIRVEIHTAQTIDKILGIGADKSIVFESLDDINRIDIIALSGVVHSYVFKLTEVPSREGANIEKFEISSWSPDSFLFTKTPYYDIINGFVEIIGIGEQFPFTVFPHITVSVGALLPIHI